MVRNESNAAERQITGERLRPCLRDLLCVLALPAMWQGSSSDSIIETLLDALIALLRLDFAHVRIKNGDEGETIQFSKSSAPARAISAQLIGQLLEGHLNQKGQGEWDPDRLAQVMTNLGSNALQHSPPGIVVQISSQCDDQYVRFKVHNEGSIDPSALPTLFDAFRRSKGAGTGNVGLGLYITKCIVTVHRGTIEVASTPENGTTFTVVLPRSTSVSEPGTADQLPRPSVLSDR